MLTRLRITVLVSVALMAALLMWLPAGSRVVEPAAASVAATENQKLWQSVLAEISSGRFDAGLQLIEQVAASENPPPEVAEIKSWLNSFRQLQNDRAARREQDYQRYINWLKEDMEAGRWRHAMINAGMAANVVSDRSVLIGQEWFKQMVEQALRRAGEYEREGKWYKAAGIYVTLQDIFPEEKSYREGLERCQEHIRLQLTYAKDSDWRTEVADITPVMAVESFKRMHEAYLHKPSFKACALSALRQIITLINESRLASELEKLADKEEVREFQERLRPWLSRIEQKNELSLTDMIEVFERVLRINKELQLLPQNLLIREFVHGALKPLDKFSDMLWPAETAEFSKHTQGKFTGVGISIRKDRGGPIRVISPLEDTPAYAAGIRPGDLITKINGRPAAPLTITRAVREITGPEGTYVTLTIKRPETGEEFDVRLKRAEITIYTIKGHQRNEKGQWNFLIDPELKIAYIRMTNFSEDTQHELRQALQALRDGPGLRGIILDLRGNPGGLLKTAVEVTSLFLSGEKEIVSTRGRGNNDSQVSTSDPEGDHYPDIPLIVLINESSASASEIVSGALQVHQRALLIGERTYGKGSVQQVLRVSPDNNAFIKLTTARYYLPNGRCLHRDEDSTTWGVDPDIPLKLTPKEMIKIANMRIRQDILKGVDQKELTKEDFDKVFSTQPATESTDEEKTEEESEMDDEDRAVKALQRQDPNDWPEVDPQLEAALMLMRIRLITNQPWTVASPPIAATDAPKSGS